MRVSRQPSDDRELVRVYLAGLEQDELVRRLVAIADRDEGLQLGLITEARAATGTLELGTLKKELTAWLRVSSRHLTWHGSREYAHEVESALDVLDGLVAAGHAEQVVALAEHVIKRLDTALNRIDDSGGYLGLPVARIADIHLRACLASRPEPRKLATRLLETALKSEWEWFLDAPEAYAEVLGEEGLAAYRERLDREWEKLAPQPPDPERRYFAREPDRFRVTHLKESLARGAGSIDELVAVMTRDLSSAHQFERIATELEAAGREREGLTWLERGLAAFGPNTDARLRDHLIDAYLRDGQVEDAVALAERAFDSHATAGTYAVLKQTSLTAGAWDTRRPLALARLRDRPDGHYPQSANEAVTVQLEEGDLDGAWRDAVARGCPDNLWRQLAEAARETRPDDAAAIYRRLVDKTLESTHHYREAVTLLKAWRETLSRIGREGELAFDLRRIRDDNRRRPKLIELLDKAGLGPV
jgi:Family of unknown function (DUF6880)